MCYFDRWPALLLNSKKKTAQKNEKVVLGPEEANQIFVEFHASAIGAHCGINKTKDAISKRFGRRKMGK